MGCYRVVCFIHAFVAGFFGLSFVFFPEATMETYNVDGVGNESVRMLVIWAGIFMICLAMFALTIAFYVKDRRAQKALALSTALGFFFCTFWAFCCTPLMNPEHGVGSQWVSVGIDGVVGILYVVSAFCKCKKCEPAGCDEKDHQQ